MADTPASGPLPSPRRLAPTTFWGKLETEVDGTISGWHPLADHCADVAAVCEALLRLPVWGARLIRLAGGAVGDILSQTQRARLCVLAALHDLGKFNIGFQAKGRPERRETAGHVREGAAAVLNWIAAAPILAEIEDWGPDAIDLLLTAIYHHGRPYLSREVGAHWRPAHWQPQDDLDPEAGLRDLMARCRRWFPMAFVRDDSTLPGSPSFAHAFAGLVMLADWIGSDTRFFQFTNDGGTRDRADTHDRMVFAREAACAALAGIGLDVPLGARADARGRDPFSRIVSAGRTPRPAQAVMTTLPLDREGSLALLEAETGSGKTEAALARFVALFDAGLVDGLYFALPTRSAATQMHARITEAARLAFREPPPVILAVPSYLKVDDVQGQRLAPFRVLWPDSAFERQCHRTWAAEHSKRYLAGCIVVGTLDQVLLSSLRVNHAHLRATSLLRHLLVVDEVHASDAYMGRLLEHVLARHRASGGHALLLSATLGSEARARLIAETRGITAGPTLADAVSTPYPLITYDGREHRAIPVTNQGSGRTIAMSTQPWLETPDNVAAAAIDAALAGATVLIIRNTVTNCVATQQAVEAQAKRLQRPDLLFTCHGVPAPHHARFAKVDREALDRALEHTLGASRSAGGRVIVATQTVQQSLDIDADILFTDLCPADVLLQRLGRLQRHARQRPDGFEQPRAIVLVPARRDLGLLIHASGTPRFHHGLGSVYPDLRILEATWRLIEAHPSWQIPAMNRELVERSLHSTTLDAIVQEQGGAWAAHAERVWGEEYGHRTVAGLNVVDWRKRYTAISFQDVQDQRIATRLGENDRLARFTPAVRGPFGHELTEITVSAYWMKDAAADIIVTKVSTIQDTTQSDQDAEVGMAFSIVRFTFGTKPFVYDRLGLRPVSDAAKEAADDEAP